MRKRGKYRPKPVLLDPLGYVVAGVRLFQDAKNEAFKIATINHAAMRSMVQGSGQAVNARELTDAMGVAWCLMVVCGLGLDWTDEITAGQQAVQTMSERGQRTGRWLFTGQEITTVNLALEVHDAQLAACTVAQLEKAIVASRKVRKAA